MKRISTLGAMILVGILSFFIFFYLMFPYAILREALSNKLSDLSGVAIRMEKLSPSFPCGLRFDNVAVDQPGRKGISLRRVEVSINPFSVLLASLSTKVYIEDANNGKFRGAVSFPLWAVLSQKSMVPSSISVEAQDFALNELVDFYLGEKARSPDMSVLLAPVVSSIAVAGKLNADVDLQINSNDQAKSQGKILLNLASAGISSKGVDLPIDNQIFSKALLKANIQNGGLIFDKDSGFTSQDLAITVAGSMAQKPELSKSTVDLEVVVEVSEKVKDQLGMVLTAVIGGEFQRKLTIKISGPISPRPSVVVM